MSTAVDDHRWQWNKNAPEDECKLSPFSAHVQQYTTQEMCEQYRNEYLSTIKILLRNVDSLSCIGFKINLYIDGKMKDIL